MHNYIGFKISMDTSCPLWVCVFIHSFIHSFLPSFIHSFTHSLIQSFIHWRTLKICISISAFKPPCTHHVHFEHVCSFIHLFIHSFIHSFLLLKIYVLWKVFISVMGHSYFTVSMCVCALMCKCIHVCIALIMWKHECACLL